MRRSWHVRAAYTVGSCPGRDGRCPGSAPDWSQGPPLGYVAELIRYWAEDYDWRRLESELNRPAQAVTRIDGVDLDFLHVRSPRPDARPLVLSHGWPSSVVEPLQVIDTLTNPASPDLPAFHVVTPSLPGFGFSGGEGDLSPKEARRLADTRRFWRDGAGYSLEQSTRPQTVACGLVDSPVAQLSWILDKFQARTYWENFPPERTARSPCRPRSRSSRHIEKLPRHAAYAREVQNALGPMPLLADQADQADQADRP